MSDASAVPPDPVPPGTGPDPEVVVTRADATDGEAVVALAGRALGWDTTGPHTELFVWKHEANPFGPSPTWVARRGDRLVGVRTFLRWRLRGPDGQRRTVVRAVDTATDPDAQGQGIFTRLTRTAIEELTDEGVAAVFNTPNDQSRPGYLKMGWQVLGRVPIAARPAGVTAALRMLGARQPAAKWSEPTSAGVDARDALADTDGLARLLDRRPVPPGWSTDLDPEVVSWRYGFAPLRYRCLPAGDRVEDGLVMFRLRSRGTATEVVVCLVLVPADSSVRIGRLLGALLHHSGADYLVATRKAGVTTAGLGGLGVPLPGQGPVLTWRTLADPWVPDQRALALTMGDVELF